MLETLKGYLVQPEFWFVTVILSLLLNIAASYLRDGIDTLAGRMSKAFDAHMKRQIERKTAYISEMASDPAILAEARHRELKTRMHVTEGLAFTAIFILLASWVSPQPYVLSGAGILCASCAVLAFLTAITSIERAGGMARDIWMATRSPKAAAIKAQAQKGD